MNILYFNDNFLPYRSGVTTFLENVSDFMAENNHNVTIVTSKRNGKAKPSHFNNKVEVFTINAIQNIFRKGTYVSFPGPFKIENILAKVKPDVIHVMSPEITSLRAIVGANINKIPIIITQHSVPSYASTIVFSPNKLSQKVGNKFFSTYYKAINNSCSYVTSPTEFIKKDLQSYGVKQKIEVISNGVDLTRFRPRLPSEQFLSKYGIPKEPLKIVMVGRIEKEKNIEVLLEAFSKTIKKVDVLLIIAGKGSLLDDFKKVSWDLGIEKKVYFLGYVPDEELQDLYNISDVFVIPALFEAQCIAALEAAASGLPLVGANAAALPEIIKHKQNGFLFRPMNSNDLNKKLLQLLKNKSLREKMGQESLKIAKKHEQHHVYRNFEQLYEKVKKEKKKRRFGFF